MLSGYPGLDGGPVRFDLIRHADYAIGALGHRDSAGLQSVKGT
jgi:hypothetical protein